MLSNILGSSTPILTLPLRKTYSKSSQLHYYFPIFHPQSSKIRAFSVSSCGNHRLQKRAIVGFDYSGRRATVGDVVNKYSLQFNQAQKYLEALSADINGLLQVSAAFLVKVSFWTSLAASSFAGLTVAFYAFPILKIINSSVADHLRDFCQGVFCNLCSGRAVEIIFSHVFGDGDPNQGIEEKRWKMIGQYIALNGGVVTAEEVAPYLDPKTTENMDDESYMLPVLQLFNGQPKVDQEGNILYHFPSVNCIPIPRRGWGKEYAGRWVDGEIHVDKFLKEVKWELRKFDAEEIQFVKNLLLYNLVCSMLWGVSTMLSDGSISYMSCIFLRLLTLYVIYAAAFWATASKRRSSIQKINAEINKRNKTREHRAKALELPDLSLKRKLSSARAMAWRASIGNDRIVYNGENDLYEQQDYDRREWDRRLKMKDSN